ncbi:MAG: lipid II flippase MurJ [bacterium]|nr:lipid II flippase MurJ [bacterium]
MVIKVFTFLNKEISGLHEAAYLLGFFALASQVLALFRDRLFAGLFGAGNILDIYYAAFRIPDMILISAASVVSVSILIPFLVERLDNSKEDGKKFIDGLFTIFFGGIVIVSALAFFTAPFFLRLLFPGFNGGPDEANLVLLSRIMLLQPIFLGLSNLFASITQVYRRFLVYALSPLAYNLGIIIGILAFYPVLGMSGLGWGVVFGAFLHFALQISILFGQKLIPKFTLKIPWTDIKNVFLVSVPRTLTMGAGNGAILILLSFASLMSAGSIAVFNLAWNLQSAPLAIIGASYSVAAFPTLSRLFKNGNQALFLHNVESAVRHIVFWSAPAMVLFIVLRAHIVRTIFGFGEFGWGETRLTAAALAIFSISVMAQSLLVLFVRAYYAFGNTRRPLVVNILGSIFIVFLGFIFTRLFNGMPIVRFFLEDLLKVGGLSGTEVLVLPLAYSIGIVSIVSVLWICFQNDFARFTPSIYRNVFHSLSGAIIMGFVAYLSLNLSDEFFTLQTVRSVFFHGFISGCAGIVAGIAVLVVVGNTEIREVWRTFHHKIWRSKLRVTVDANDNPNM